MPPEFRPDEIVRVLAAHRVDLVVIGGFAATALGAPFPTDDIDITPERSAGNLARLSAALYAVEARIRTDVAPEGLPFHHDADSLAAARVWDLTTKFGDLDISFEPSGTGGYEDLNRSAITIDIVGTPARVASLADIVRSKQAANRDKDQRVLPALRQILDRQRRPEP